MHIVLLKCPNVQIAFLKFTSGDNQALVGCIPIATVAVHRNPEIKIGQSSHKMYHNKHTEFSRVYDNFKFLYKKVWKIIEGTTYVGSPSHIWVRGNERADSTGKSALDLTPDNFRILFADLKPQINKLLHTKWQQHWNNNLHHKFFQIQPTLGEWRPAFKKSRREQVIISRLHIGHTRLTRFFILKQDQQPVFDI